MQEAESLEERISSAVTACVEIASGASTEPYIREAIVKMVIRDMAWSLLERFPNEQFDISDQLSNMGDIIKDHSPDSGTA